jgi:protoporphyrin/coproporphyrin ferrochelatase
MGHCAAKPNVGVLLINLGTPDDTEISSIRRYLREFLLDPRVIDLPAFFRYLLVYGAILPFRPFKTAKAYEKIWQANGSPLRTHTQDLSAKVGKCLGGNYRVKAAMRYGNPSIASALKELSDCKEIIVLPLFPQYSSAATGSAIAKTFIELSKQWNLPAVKVIDQFYSRQEFTSPLAELIKPYISDPETYLLFSYHGLPERHLDKSHCKSPCERRDACPLISNENYFCYRAQCYETSRLVAKKLLLNSDRHTSAFQSRLGKIPWIKPYTDEVFPRLYANGIKKLVVACPAFTADCLETLEEIGIQAKEQWLALGGKSFELVPCLNSHDSWVQGVANFVKQS